MKRADRGGNSGPKILLLVVAVGAAGAPGLAVPGAHAQEGGVSEGRLMIGYRSVDVGGELHKYREDINLGDGPRLMEMSVSLTPGDALGGLVDRIRVDLDDLGGEPFESLRVEARRYGRYHVRYERQESDYFYHDQLFPSGQMSARNARSGDFHTFDFRRVRDRATLDLDVGERAAVTLGLDRYSKKGRSTTTLSLQRDEFEVDRPIDEISFESNVGFRYAWDRVTLSLEERYSEYENAHELFLPGRSTGAFPDDETVVDFFFLDQPYAFTSRSHALRVVATPLDRLTVRASGTLQDLDLDVRAHEESAGTGFQGNPFSTDVEGEGGIEKNLDLWDLDATYLIGERWGVVAGSYLRSLDQDGELLLGGVPRRGRWDVRTRGFEGGIQWTSGRSVDLTVGLRRESRDVERTAVEGGPLPDAEETSTDQIGYFGTISWRPDRRLSLTLDWEDGSVDDPFTLASATDHGRLKASGRYTLESGPWLSASYQRSRRENRNSGWDAEHDLATVRLGYRNDRVNAHAGYSRIEVDRRYEAEVEGTFGPSALFDVDHRLSSSLLDALIRVRAADDLWVGAQLRHHDNDGSFALARRDHRLFGEYRFPAGYLARVGLRFVDYDEAAFDFDDYDAVIVDVGVGYGW